MGSGPVRQMADDERVGLSVVFVDDDEVAKALGCSLLNDGFELKPLCRQGSERKSQATSSRSSSINCSSSISSSTYPSREELGLWNDSRQQLTELVRVRLNTAPVSAQQDDRNDTSSYPSGFDTRGNHDLCWPSLKMV